MSTGNVILDVAEERGAKHGAEEIARNMLLANHDVLDILRITGIDADKLHEMRKTMHSEAESAREVCIRNNIMEEIAKKMFVYGIDSLDIIDITGLSVEHLREIREAMRNESA